MIQMKIKFRSRRELKCAEFYMKSLINLEEIERSFFSDMSS